MTGYGDEQFRAGRPDAFGAEPRSEVPSEHSFESPSDVVDDDDDELVQLATERDELRELAQRVQADFENYRKRMLREQAAVSERATESIIRQLLPVLDSFEMALGSLEQADDNVRKGVELVFAEFLAALERAGLERIDTDGQLFDPEVHEAVLHDEGDGEPIVAETMRQGYRIKGKVVRPAMVRVSR